MALRATVPKLALSQRVIDKMVKAASKSIEDETGEAMIGLVLPPEKPADPPTIYVLDTISPDESAVRQMHTFQQGDAWQDELIWWYQENWHLQREKRRKSYGQAATSRWDAPLRYLGDWHKQPGDMIAPSDGDLMTALDWLDDPDCDMNALLVPIVTLGHSAAADDSPYPVNYITAPLEDGTLMRVDWWYIHREIRSFQPMFPVIYDAERTPGLTCPPWHLRDEARAEAEFARFQADGLAFSVLFFDVDGELPLEVCITAARLGGRKLFLLATTVEYPRRPPQVRLVPFQSIPEGRAIADMFGEWWHSAEPVANPPGWTWTEDKFLVDMIRAIESHLEMPHPVPQDAQPTAPDHVKQAEEKERNDDDLG